MIKLAISGSQGRMGTRIHELAKSDKALKATVLLEHKDHQAVGTIVDGIKVTFDPQTIKGADVLIEFTSPDATIIHLQECVKQKMKMVIGTTGLTAEQVQIIKDASKTIPIVFSSNMSVGVNILFSLAKTLAQKTAGAYTVKIVEAHHIHKKDAPSG